MHVRLGSKADDRTWEPLAQYVKEGIATVSIVDRFEHDSWWLEADGPLTDGDLFLISGTLEGAEGTDDYRLYRIYTVKGEELLMCSDDSPAGGGAGPWRMGGWDHWRDGRWNFDPRDGAVTARGNKYRLGPDCPLYLQAIAENWTWEDHFGAVLALADDEGTQALSNCENPVMASELVRILTQMIRLREQQAKDAERLEQVLGAIHEIGRIAWAKRQSGRHNPLHSLVRYADPTAGSCALVVAEDFVTIFSACQAVDPGHFDEKDPIWQYDGRSMFI